MLLLCATSKYTDEIHVNCCRTNYGYKTVDVDIDSNTDHIKLDRTDCNSSMFGGDAPHIFIDIVYMSDWLLRVKVSPTNEQKFVVISELYSENTSL